MGRASFLPFCLLFGTATLRAQPPLGTWTPAATLRTECASDCVTLRDGRTLALADARIYDPATKVWKPAMRMLQTRTGYSVTVLADGRVLVAGGGTNSLELFDPKTNAWSTVAAQLSCARSRHAAALLQDGRVLIAGGWDGADTLITSDVFDPVSGTVTPSGLLTVARAGHTAPTLIDGRVLIAGGDGLASAEIYDPDRQSFSATGAMTVARTGQAAILLPDNNHVLLAGGAELATAEIFDPWTGRFAAAAPMAAPHANAVAATMRRGVVVVSGGDAAPEGFHFPTVIAELKAGSIDVDGEGWTPGEPIRLSLPEHHILTAVAGANGSIAREIPAAHGTEAEDRVEAKGKLWTVRVALKTGTTTTIDGNPVQIGTQYPGPLSLSITVYSAARTAAGTVDLVDTGTNLTVASGSLANGHVTINLVLNAGSYTIVAVYEGDALSYGSQSASVTVSFSQGTVTLTGSGSANPAVYGQPLQATFQAGYGPGGSVPTGTVYFYPE